MTCDLLALCVDTREPLRLAEFWARLLGWELAEGSGPDVALLPSDDTGFVFRFGLTERARSGPNRMHLDLTSTSPADQQRTVARALELGARHLDVGQRPDEGHVVLADPDGNEFCVVEPGNSFLADCGLVGALSCDGTQAVGHFWSQALGWPLVWDQDGETAIRSPRGGPKISWGGPPVAARTGPDRVTLEVAPRDRADATELARLLSLGATRLDTAPGRDDRMVLADPDGNEFGLLAPRHDDPLVAAPARQVLVIGLDPYRAPGPWDPAPVAEAVAAGMADLAACGFDAEQCLVALDGSDDVEARITTALRSRGWDCVLVGGGIRKGEDLLMLFESIVNLVRRHAPQAEVAFNDTLHDIAEAVVRRID